MNTDKALFVHHFLEHSAQRFPEKEAVIFQKQRLTYREIDNSANALAWKLHEMGAKTLSRMKK